MKSIKTDCRALYVEDSDDTRIEVASYLDYILKETYVASNGNDGLSIYKKFKPDVVILDLNIPPLNGIELSRELKKIDQAIPIIITTAYNETNYRKALSDMGITDILIKPFLLDKLKDSIIHCTEQHS